MALATLFVTIPAGQALSTPLEIASIYRVVRIGMPDGWNSAAPITFQISAANDVYWDLHHVAQTQEGGWFPYPVSVLQVIPNSVLLLPPDSGTNLGWLRIRSGTYTVPVNQKADRTFAIVVGAV